MRETAKAMQAWADYLGMGPERSLEKLARLYRSRSEADPPEGVPTVELTTIKEWSREHGWQARIAEITAEIAAERERFARLVPFASWYERVILLDRAVHVLAAEVFPEADGDSRRWLPDVKQIGTGQTAERVDIERFNSGEIEQLRGMLDDLAKETGGRVQKQEHTGPEGGPIPIKVLQGVDLDRV